MNVIGCVRASQDSNFSCSYTGTKIGVCSSFKFSGCTLITTLITHLGQLLRISSPLLWPECWKYEKPPSVPRPSSTHFPPWAALHVKVHLDHPFDHPFRLKNLHVRCDFGQCWKYEKPRLILARAAHTFWLLLELRTSTCRADKVIQSMQNNWTKDWKNLRKHTPTTPWS